MPTGMLPPFGEPSGAPTDDASLLAAFAEGGEVALHSPGFHTEDDVLVVNPDVAAAIRLERDTVLVRADLPPDLAGAQRRVEDALSAAGMTRLDEQTKLGHPVAIQKLGIRVSLWDLWGADIDRAFAALRSAAVGDPWA